MEHRCKPPARRATGPASSEPTSCPSVDLDVAPGSSTVAIAGGVVAGVGVGSMVAGLLVSYVPPSAPATMPSDGVGVATHTTGASTSQTIAGVVLGSVGAALVIGGIVAFFYGLTTVDVHGSDAPVAARAPRYWVGEF